MVRSRVVDLVNRAVDTMRIERDRVGEIGGQSLSGPVDFGSAEMDGLAGNHLGDCVFGLAIGSCCLEQLHIDALGVDF